MALRCWIDDREERTTGLKALVRQWGVYGDVERMEYGDVAWAGKEDGKKVVVGLERKTVGDLLSVIESKRFTGRQLEGLLENYHHVYLLVEGRWRCGKAGELEEYGRVRGKYGWRKSRSRLNYWAVSGWLETMANCCGVEVRQTDGLRDTAALVRVLAGWWAKGEHKAHKGVYIPGPSGKVSFVRPNLVWRMAAQLPGIERKGEEISRKFGSAKEMCGASEKEWREVKGIGKVLAGNIVKLLNGG
jgi:ERCC4-type nuclease